MSSRRGGDALLLDVGDVVPRVADAQVEQERDEREREQVAPSSLPDQRGADCAEERDRDPNDGENLRRRHPRRAAILVLRAVLLPAEKGDIAAPEALPGGASTRSPGERESLGVAALDRWALCAEDVENARLDGQDEEHDKHEVPPNVTCGARKRTSTQALPKRLREPASGSQASARCLSCKRTADVRDDHALHAKHRETQQAQLERRGPEVARDSLDIELRSGNAEWRPSGHNKEKACARERSHSGRRGMRSESNEWSGRRAAWRH